VTEGVLYQGLRRLPQSADAILPLASIPSQTLHFETTTTLA
jgi:hypothetical protein